MSCVRAKNLGLQNKSDACPLPVVVSRMTEASCSIRPPWNSGSSAERGMATSRPPPAREVPTGTNRPGRARVLCLPRDPALLAPWARAACLASVGSVPRDRPAACPARAWAASLPASVRCSQPAARGRAVPAGAPAARDGAAASVAVCARWCRALACLLRAMVPTRPCCARWCRALARCCRAMVPRAGLLAARDGAAHWRPCCARWCRALAGLLRAMVSRSRGCRALACLLRAMDMRALAPMLRSMVPRTGAHAALDGAARLRAVVARWCRAHARCWRAMVPRVGALLPRAGAARWWRAQARWLRASAGHFSHEGRLAVREMACQCPRVDVAKNSSFCTPIFFLFLLKNCSYFSRA